jgi:hypothetical protein
MLCTLGLTALVSALPIKLVSFVSSIRIYTSPCDVCLCHSRLPNTFEIICEISDSHEAWKEHHFITPNLCIF